MRQLRHIRMDYARHWFPVSTWSTQRFFFFFRNRWPKTDFHRPKSSRQGVNSGRTPRRTRHIAQHQMKMSVYGKWLQLNSFGVLRLNAEQKLNYDVLAIRFAANDWSIQVRSAHDSSTKRWIDTKMSQNRRHKAITQTHIHIRLWKHEKRFARILLIRNESANRFFPFSLFFATPSPLCRPTPK